MERRCKEERRGERDRPWADGREAQVHVRHARLLRVGDQVTSAQLGDDRVPALAKDVRRRVGRRRRFRAAAAAAMTALAARAAAAAAMITAACWPRWLGDFGHEAIRKRTPCAGVGDGEAAEVGAGARRRCGPYARGVEEARAPAARGGEGVEEHEQLEEHVSDHQADREGGQP